MMNMKNMNKGQKKYNMQKPKALKIWSMTR